MVVETPSGVCRNCPTGTDETGQKGSVTMSEDKKEKIREMVSIMKDLDKESVLILTSGAQMLKVRQEMKDEEHVGTEAIRGL